MATTTSGTRGSAAPQACSGCGSPLAEDQRYCLNCGARAGDPRLPGEELLSHVAADEPPAPGAAPAGSVVVAPPHQRDWMPLIALGALGLLALVLVIGVLIGKSGSNSGSAAPQVITIGGGAAAAAPAAGTATATFTSDWSGGDGWTIEIGTLPKASATAAQVASAKSAATGKGVAAVGALDSDTYPSLPSGEYVLYSGTFTSKSAAKKALAKVKAAYPSAKVVQVSSSGGGAGGASAAGAAGGTAGTPVAPASSATGSTYEKQSAKSPTQQSTGNGPPPAPDHKKAGGGSTPTTIG